MFQEKDYTNFLISKYNNTSASRGTVTASNKKEEKKKDNIIKSFALLVANDTFDATKNWSSLKNPINDVNVVAKILKEKYNTETLILHNKGKNEILKSINNMKSKMDDNDQFLFFIAGHGYYSEEMSDGMVVCKESREIEQDYDKSSYLKMADLHRLLNTMPAKNVFAVFDVCFGATFDLFAKDIAINNYNKLQLDIKLEDFIKRKNSETSRIFMASGRYEVPDYWKDSEDHSPFASKLIKALSEEKEFISPGKIFSFMDGNATEPLLKKFGKHKPRGDFLLKVVE
ncbi:MAG: caspase family protein [Polaribacter sp.]|uniref:caspase family protein n=1 Tax=Polaribacter sp. TaxID=1920175 RepID=UPI002F35CFAD